MEYFATYGGCTAAGATGLAVLRVLRQERMQERAVETGAYLLEKLRAMQQVRRTMFVPWHVMNRRCVSLACMISS